ncbi:hypothetical protein JTB14_033088 [Gonioctena quinquepunctata]|nr:hypothetical protein JTB14_033088 [Gonioctena quinquepunctata]
MLSRSVVLFSLYVLQTYSEQFKCDVVPFETNDIKGHCCVYLKERFNRPSDEEINRQLHGVMNEKKIQPVINPYIKNDPESRRHYPVDENPNVYGSSGSILPAENIYRNKPRPVIQEDYMDSVTQSNLRNFGGMNPSQNDDRNEQNNRNKPRPGIDSAPQEGYRNHDRMDPFQNNDRNEPKIGSGSKPVPDEMFHRGASNNDRDGFETNRYIPNNTERTVHPVDNTRQQEKGNQSLSQRKNASGHNINVTDAETMDKKKTNTSSNTVPDIGNRNNVNVPDTCTEGYAKTADGKCVEIFN